MGQLMTNIPGLLEVVCVALVNTFLSMQGALQQHHVSGVSQVCEASPHALINL